jgi:ParB family chromosome partitioning protein
LSTVPERPRRGLGRGFDVLIGGADAEPELRHLPLADIHPNPRQPRRRFDADAASGLAESIRTQGLIQPVVVRPRPQGGYELVAGERRWRASAEAGLETVPAIVRTTGDRETLLLALVENVAREDLSPVEEARAYALLIDEFDLLLGEVAGRVGRSKPSVSNRIRLLELPDDVLALVEGGGLTEGHARAVLAVPGNEERRRLARRIVRDGMSVRSAEKAARSAGAATKTRRTHPVDPVLAARARAAAERLTGRTVVVRAGRIEIEFADEVELEELVEALERIES